VLLLLLLLLLLRAAAALLGDVSHYVPHERSMRGTWHAPHGTAVIPIAVGASARIVVNGQTTPSQGRQAPGSAVAS
jgi:hypothetical protein